MTPDDYPADMSNHVRDPKIFKKNEKYLKEMYLKDNESKWNIDLSEHSKQG